MGMGYTVGSFIFVWVSFRAITKNGLLHELKFVQSQFYEKENKMLISH